MIGTTERRVSKCVLYIFEARPPVISWLGLKPSVRIWLRDPTSLD